MDVSGFRYQQPETSGLPQQASIQPESRGAILGSHLQRRYTQIKEGEGFWSSLLSRIRECLHVIFDADYSFEAEEKETLDTHHVAEHLGQGSYFHLATKNTIHLLQQMEPKPQSLIDQLTFAYTISKELFENPTRPASVVKKWSP